MPFELIDDAVGESGPFIPARLAASALVGGTGSGGKPDSLSIELEIPGGRLSLAIPFRQALDLREVISECVRHYPELLKQR